ncbi:MAG TPA: glycoside hydrolase family 31 protein [Saprospiraceae bacterium]|nr:glycoside hydrolase family 31 protein [Saprospiraceae bacterium]HMQ82664.1 glycoside hydrolase family 31 protein [Saprospiraceae bacterium]
MENTEKAINKTRIVPESESLTTARYLDVYWEKSPQALMDFQDLGNGSFLLRASNGVHLRIEVWENGIIRFRYSSDAFFQKEFAYAIDPAYQRKTVPVTAYTDESIFSLQTAALHLSIDKNSFKIQLWDAKKKQLLLEEEAGFKARHSIMNGLEWVSLSLKAQESECYYGLGDKTCPMNLRGYQLENWNTDAFGYEKDSDPLYRSIPFYYGLHQNQAYGIFLNNPHRSQFDFDSQQTGELLIQAYGGEMDYFFLYGPEMAQVNQAYIALTGKPELPPLWALGFHQCRWSYYPESRVMEIAQTFRELEIPCDAIYLDIDYMDGYRCFTWNREYFPDPTRMIQKLAQQGFQTVVMIDPGIRVDEEYAVYQSGLEKDVFCRRTSGEVMKGPVWPPECVFPDYTHPAVREWWGALYQELYNEHGVSGFWNDMNEPAVFKVATCTFPDQVLHDFDGQGGDHRKAHNIYGQQMSRATYDGLKKLQPDKRPFVLTRASFSGGQRYASLWTGDNVASWDHLRLANVQCQRLSISGFSFVGSDIGGFKDQPDGELFVRWLQLAAFHPFFRVHTMGNNMDGAAEADAETIKKSEAENRQDQEPWSFGEPFTSQARKAISFRYQLLPYLYTAFYQYCQSGNPIIKSLAYYDQKDSECLLRENEFIFGDQLLVVPVLEAGAEQVSCYLPKGEWVDYESGQILKGQQEISHNTSDEHLPIFAKAGAVVPNYPVQQYMGQKSLDQIDLRIYFGSAKSPFYEDAGDAYDYLKEDGYCLRHFETLSTPQSLTIHQTIEGNPGIVPHSHFQVQFYGLPFEAKSLLCDQVAIPLIKTAYGYNAVVRADFDKLELL